jgi:hypothetical protein
LDATKQKNPYHAVKVLILKNILKKSNEWVSDVKKFLIMIQVSKREGDYFSKQTSYITYNIALEFR